jgi:hypothetical protein
VAYETRSKVPRATSFLLIGCAAIQLVASVTGLCGFKSLNRECVCASFLTMSGAILALGYVAGATYLWLRDTTPAEPQHLLFVFGVAAVATTCAPPAAHR